MYCPAVLGPSVIISHGQRRGMTLCALVIVYTFIDSTYTKESSLSQKNIHSHVDLAQFFVCVYVCSDPYMHVQS